MSGPAWERLRRDHSAELVDELERLYGQGGVVTTAQGLASATGSTEAQALTLLRANGDWLEPRQVAGDVDPDYPDDPPPMVTQFEWTGARSRDTAWLLLVHGMNTKGLWQEYLAFDVGVWQGKNVPTFVHKYGWVVVGVILPWRRAKLRCALRDRIVELSRQTPDFNLGAHPDVVCHSFGTWLIGHVLVEQLERLRDGLEPELRVGRVILTGSILRPDFDWPSLQAAGLVEDVLNHYGTGDRIVPLAHYGIFDSGPSGRRGFDDASRATGSPQVLNVSADGFAHSQLFADRERYDSFSSTWKVFLSNPRGDASSRIAPSDPDRRWGQAVWPLRGTLLPVVGVPLLVVLLVWGLVSLGGPLSWLDDNSGGVLQIAAVWLAIAGAGPLAVLFLLHRTSLLFRRR